MKLRVFSVIIFVLIIVFIAFAENEDPATFNPKQPKIGDVISIQYNAASKMAIHKKVKEIVCEVLILRESGMPLLLEIPLKKHEKIWSGNFKLGEQKAQFILFRFVSGDNIDDFDGRSWETLIYGQDGVAIRGSHYARCATLSRDEYLGFKRKKDKDAIEKEMKTELELYPDNFSAWIGICRTKLRANPSDSIMRSEMKSEFEKLWENNKENENAAASLVGMFELLGMKEKGDSIIQQIMMAHPKGLVAKTKSLNAIFQEKDMLKRVEKAEKYFEDYPEKGEMLEQNISILISTYLQAGLYDKAEALLESQKEIINANYYNSLAWNLIEKGEKLEQATAWAKKGVSMFRTPNPKTKPSYLSTKGWKKTNIQGLGMTLDTYAYGLFKLKKTNEAEKAYEEASKLLDGKVPNINARLLECYNINGKFNKTIKAAEEFIQQGNADDKIIDYYKIAYVKVKGTDKGFDKLLDQKKIASQNAAKAKIAKEMINQPSIDFALKDMSGKNIRLSEQKGKVVLLDFWATWCGPCKASFPALQRIYNKYKDNANVAILAINTWENETGKSREDLVKKFIEENKYSFAVLFDEGFVEKYGVEGIPTQFIIDKNGKIRFKSLGADSEQKIIAKIDLLLK